MRTFDVEARSAACRSVRRQRGSDRESARGSAYVSRLLLERGELLQRFRQLPRLSHTASVRRSSQQSVALTVASDLALGMI